MLALFADSTELFSPHLPGAIVGSLIFVIVGLLLMTGAWRVIDFITPGKLNDEILGTGRLDGKPNMALAVVVAAMVLAVGVIIAASIH